MGLMDIALKRRHRERQQAAANLMSPIIESYEQGLMQTPQQKGLMAQPQRTPEGFNIDLPQAQFADRAALQSAFIESAPSLDPTTTKYVQGLMGSQQTGEAPSAVREYKYWKNLPEKEKAAYMGVKRAQKFLDIGSGFVAPSQVDPTIVQDVARKELRPSEMPAYLAKKKETTMKTAAQTKAQIEIGKSQIQYDKNKTLVSDVLSHKGLESAFGVSSYAPVIRGSERAGFEAKLNQLKNTVFITNREALKGGGSITDYEGNKAEEAELRATNAQSSEEFRKAMKDYEYWIDRGFKQLQKTAKGDFSLEEIMPKAPLKDIKSLVDKYAD